MKSLKEWMSYEEEIAAHFRTAYPGATVCHNVKLPGVLTGTARQVDVLIEAGTAEFPIKIVVEARYLGRKINVEHVEGFLTKLRDVQAHVGVMVCPLGYTQSAMNLARTNGHDIYLEVLNPAELKAWQGPTAIPYSRGNGVSLIAPLGWVIDGSKRPGTLARMYPRGKTEKEAIREAGWMYVNFWTKTEEIADISALLEDQWRYLSTADGANIEIMPGIRSRYNTQIRCFSRLDYPELIEVTGFVDFDRFILMCVTLGCPARKLESIRRTRFVMEGAFPMEVNVVASSSD